MPESIPNSGPLHHLAKVFEAHGTNEAHSGIWAQNGADQGVQRFHETSALSQGDGDWHHRRCGGWCRQQRCCQGRRGKAPKILFDFTRSNLYQFLNIFCGKSPTNGVFFGCDKHPGDFPAMFKRPRWTGEALLNSTGCLQRLQGPQPDLSHVAAQDLTLEAPCRVEEFLTGPIHVNHM